MLQKCKVTPARLWRAFLLAGLAGLAIPASAAPASKTTRVPSDFGQFGPPDQAKGERILGEFRNLGVAGDYYLQFELQVLPRRGERMVYAGRLWGGRNESGPISRVELEDGRGQVQRLLIQSGPEPRIWSGRQGESTEQLMPAASLYAPLLEGSELTPFDLLMPYLYWRDFVFEGVSKVLGRAAHTFLMKPPAGDPAEGGRLAAVRVQLDTQFRAMVQSELLNTQGEVYKSLTLRDLKKVGDQWMIKAIDLRNEQTRDKTRFQVLRAAVGLDLSPAVFEPSSLAGLIAPPEQTESLGR
ncbi:MAG: outer membrane lipoprotein-sorting protein [Opitutaceae bacterium]|nr:outer membrane lipoprotein-sorting protein [Opitutaceae bacterium]